MSENELNEDKQDIGKILRSTRLESKLTLDQVSKALCISKSILKKLEESTQDLPRDVYVVGHIRCYAEFLSLDADKIVKEFRADAAPPPPLDQKAFLLPLPQEGIPKSRILLGSAALALVLGFGLHYFSGFHSPFAQQIIAQVTDEPIHPEQNQSEIVAVVDDEPIEARFDFAAEDPDVTSQEEVLNESLASVIIENPSSVSAEENLTELPEETKIAEVVTKKEQTLLPASNASDVLMIAKEDTWVEVRNLMGDVVISKIFHPGEKQLFPSKDALILHTGNAGGITLTFDGYTTPPLGDSGEVIGNITLTPEKLLARYPKKQ